MHSKHDLKERQRRTNHSESFPLWGEGLEGSEGSKGSEGKDCPAGNDYEVSVTGIAFCYINRAEYSAELATCVATPYPAAPDSPLFRGENRLLYTFL